MKNTLFLLLILLLSLILIRCTEKSMEAGNPDRVFTQPVEWKEKFKLSEYVEDFEILTFHNNDSILLSSILRLQIYDQRIYIRCWERGVIFVFDRHLNHVINIRPSGSGPLEFSTLTDYYIDYPQHLLYVLDGILGKVVSFDLKTYQPVEEVNLAQLNPVGFAKVDDQFIFITNDFEKGIIKFYDIHSNQILLSQITKPQSVNMINSLAPFFHYKNKLLMGLSFADTIYQYDGQRFQPFATVGKNETSMASLDFQELQTELFETRIFSEKTKKTYIPVGFNFSVSEMIFVTLGLHSGGSTIIIHPDLKKSILLKKKSIDDFSLFFNDGLIILDTDDKGFYYSYVMPNRLFLDSIEKTIQEQKTTPLAKYLTSFIEQFPEEAWGENPFIIKFKLKPNALESLLF